MKTNYFTNRHGDVIPATEESITLIKFSVKQSEAFFGEKLPQKGNHLDYASYFQERIKLLENWIEQNKRALTLYRGLAGIADPDASAPSAE